MQKPIVLISLVVILISCINNTSNKDTVKGGNLSPQDSLYTSFDIKPFIGEWFYIKNEKGLIHTDTNFIKDYIKKNIFIYENEFNNINSKCVSITYRLSNQRNTRFSKNKFVQEYSLKQRNIPLIEIIDSNNQVCDGFYLISQDTLIGVCDGIYFFYKKHPSLYKANNDNDTVRCKERAKCAETGFVLKGSRKNGKAIHVKPKNTNVPMED